MDIEKVEEIVSDMSMDIFALQNNSEYYYDTYLMGHLDDMAKNIYKLEKLLDSHGG